MLEVAAWALEPSPAGRGRWRAGAEARQAQEQLPAPPRREAAPPRFTPCQYPSFQIDF